MKYSVIIPYYKRANHLWNTLISYRRWYSSRTDYEIIIIEDNGNATDAAEHRELLNVIAAFADLRIVHLTSEHGHQWNPVRHRNQAARAAQGSVFVLTNPECYHKVDILGELERMGDLAGRYVVCACASCKLSISRAGTLDELVANEQMIEWYQHSVHNNRKLHFCTVITRTDYNRIGGFDEAYAPFCGYDDDDFREKIRVAGIAFVVRDDMVTVHVAHERSHQAGTEPAQRAGLAFYNKKWGYNRTQ